MSMRILSARVLVVAVLLFGIVFTAPHERAYAATSAPPGMLSAIAALVATTAVANGFSSADPRIAATVAAIGTAAAGYAAALASAAGTAIGSVPWIAVGAAAGLGAILGAVPTSLGDDSLQSWQFNHDGTVTVTKGAAGSNPDGSAKSPFLPLTAGVALWTAAGGYQGSSAEAVEAAYEQGHNLQALGYTVTCSAATNAAAQCLMYYPNSTVSAGGFGVGLVGTYSSSSPSCSSGMVGPSGCMTYSPPPPPAPVTESISAAVAGVDAGDMGDPLNPQILAGLTNSLWQSAAADGEGYAGLPYPVNAPVTSGQAATVEGQLGTSAPTVGSAVSGAGTLTGVSTTAPFTGTGAGAGSGASSVPVATNPGSGAQVNLGPDPGIGAPGLETPPTAAQILAPILGLMADLKRWAVPAHTSECPEPSFELWGQTYSFTAQCDLLAQYGTQITVAFEVGFAVAAVLIVLTA